MSFPYDFGFVPSTRGGDGDPLDVLVLMDEPAFPGCKLSAQVIGIIEGEQGTKKNKERNDRIVAVQSDTHSYSHIRRIEGLGKKFVQELKSFSLITTGCQDTSSRLGGARTVGGVAMHQGKRARPILKGGGRARCD